MAYKIEEAPLLGPGRHTMTLSELRALAVDDFAQSSRRRELWRKFESLYQQILDAGFPCEIWVDGSFLTEEQSPKDIDFTIHVDVELMETSTPEMREILDRFDQGEEPGELDGFVCTVYPRGHERFGTELDENWEWAKQWGVSRQDWLKGIAVLRPSETDVGLSIRS